MTTDKQIIFSDPYERKSSRETDNLFLYDIQNHYMFVEYLYNDYNFREKNVILRELRKKLSSYKSQDKLKCKFDQSQFITLNELISKLYESMLKCYYCEESLLLIYKQRKETRQWSLERFDNNIGHYNSNTCISCLKCNLQRRTDNFEYFKMGKQLRIKREKCAPIHKTNSIPYFNENTKSKSLSVNYKPIHIFDKETRQDNNNNNTKRIVL
jgi:hypothetical protein